jgi:signal peptidase I
MGTILAVSAELGRLRPAKERRPMYAGRVPLWAYIAVLLLVFLLSPLIGVGLFAAAARICRAPTPIGRRYIRLVTVVFYAMTLSSAALIGTDSHWPKLVAALLDVGAFVVLGHIVTKAGWGRSLVIFVVYAALIAPVSLVLAFGLQRSIAHSFLIPTSSMAPAIRSGDRIFVDRTLPLRRWDIVVYRRPWERGIWSLGRLVGLPCETIEIVPPGIKVNGDLIPMGPDMRSVAYTCTPVPGAPSQQSLICNGCGTPITLGPDEYFFLGDNSTGALDSRYWEAMPGHQAGALPADRILGVARLRYAPFDRLHAFR